MSNPFANNGTRFYIATGLPFFSTIEAYAILNFTQIIGVRSIGEIGNSYDAIDFNTIGNIRYNKKMGKAALSITIELINLAGIGQSMINALVNTTSAAAAFKIIATDNTTYYFTAECSSNLAVRGDSSIVSNRKLTLNVNSELIEF